MYPYPYISNRCFNGKAVSILTRHTGTFSERTIFDKDNDHHSSYVTNTLTGAFNILALWPAIVFTAILPLSAFTVNS